MWQQACLRNLTDYESALERLRNHSGLQLQPHGMARKCEVAGGDEKVLGLTQFVVQRLPFLQFVPKGPRINLSSGYCELDPGWLGFQCENEIHIFFPAFETTTSFLFSLFHEYGHWLFEQQVVSEHPFWDEFFSCQLPRWQHRAQCSRDWEDVADTFAWYFVNPVYLRLIHSSSYLLLDQFVHEFGFGAPSSTRGESPGNN